MNKNIVILIFVSILLGGCATKSIKSEKLIPTLPSTIVLSLQSTKQTVAYECSSNLVNWNFYGISTNYSISISPTNPCQFYRGYLTNESITLTWDASSDTNTSGYKIYVGTQSHVYTETIDIGNVTAISIVVTNVAPINYFAASAYDTYGNNSSYSNEATYTNSPFKITLLK